MELSFQQLQMSLNPCFDGICYMSLLKTLKPQQKMRCLNPYYNGICSMSMKRTNEMIFADLVLILVLMEYAI